MTTSSVVISKWMPGIIHGINMPNSNKTLSSITGISFYMTVLDKAPNEITDKPFLFSLHLSRTKQLNEDNRRFSVALAESRILRLTDLCIKLTDDLPNLYIQTEVERKIMIDCVLKFGIVLS